MLALFTLGIGRKILASNLTFSFFTGLVKNGLSVLRSSLNNLLALTDNLSNFSTFSFFSICSPFSKEALASNAALAAEDFKDSLDNALNLDFCESPGVRPLPNLPGPFLMIFALFATLLLSPSASQVAALCPVQIKYSGFSSKKAFRSFFMGALPPETLTFLIVFHTEILLKAENAPRLIRCLTSGSSPSSLLVATLLASGVLPTLSFSLFWMLDKAEFLPFVATIVLLLGCNNLAVVSLNRARKLVAESSTLFRLFVPPAPPLSFFSS
mmetsp:Transcript_4853/g.5014  ORF Transcript_4853/g.5014 Transcript_4853/m.5014 type:complete len:269 (-) Transcript_4853:2347-3153(-)